MVMAKAAQALKFEETANEGLKREFKVVVAAKDLASRAEERLNSMKQRVKIPGFRPGKVPTAHIKKLYGRQVMGEVLNDAVGLAAREIATEKKIKLAGEPQIDFPKDEKLIEAIMDGTADLSFTMKVEVLPKIDVGDFKKIKVTKDVTAVTDADVDKAISRIADQHRHYHPEEGRAAQNEDRVLIDYEGSIDNVPFEGGKAENTYLALGSNQFIPGFEEQLTGAKAGDERTISVTFPDPYQAAPLAGKKASFKVKVKEVAKVEKHEVIDDHFAQHLGVENLPKLKEAVREQIAREDAHMSRQKLKRRLLDALDEEYDFELPPSLVDQEFNMIWQQIENEMKQTGQTYQSQDTSEDKAKENYRAIAIRRVRLGLLLAEIGEKNKIQVTQDEMNRGMMERIRQFPGREKEVYEFYKKNPNALAEIRAPLYEDKVIDYILELSQVSENKVSREELFKAEDEEMPKAKDKPAKKKAAKK
jgi:trigger factor